MKMQHPDNPKHVIEVRPEHAEPYRQSGWVEVKKDKQ